MEDIDFWADFVDGNSNKLQKKKGGGGGGGGFERKKQQSQKKNSTGGGGGGGTDRKNQQSPSKHLGQGHRRYSTWNDEASEKKNQQFCFYQLEGFVFVVCTVRVVVKGKDVLTVVPL